jgi:putative tryptophan/tyrosine transport system substrate-binding protein
VNSRRVFLHALAGGLAVASFAHAQSSRRVPTVGFLTLGGVDSLAQFKEAMRDFGYVEGRDLVIERRSSEGTVVVLPELAAELVRLNVDVIYATGPAAVKAAHEATQRIPIVALDLETDPVASGLVRSLGRPGSNVTGLFLDQPALAGKWLELLTEILPGRRRIVALWDVATGAPQLAAARTAAKRFGVDLRTLEFSTRDELVQKLRQAPDGGTQAIVMLTSPIVSVNSALIAEWTWQNRMPAISPFRAFAEGGGLLSYGPDLVAFRRISAAYVDKILKGANVAELPVQQPTLFQLVVNQKTAKALGIAIPQSVLLRADEVIQ